MNLCMFLDMKIRTFLIELQPHKEPSLKSTKNAI